MQEARQRANGAQQRRMSPPKASPPWTTRITVGVGLFFLLLLCCVGAEGSTPYGNLATPTTSRRSRLHHHRHETTAVKNAVSSTKEVVVEHFVHQLFDGIRRRNDGRPPQVGTRGGVNDHDNIDDITARQMLQAVQSPDFTLSNGQWAVPMGPPIGRGGKHGGPHVPIVRLLFQLHRMNPECESIRGTLLHLLRIGLDPNSATQATAHEPPLIYTALLSTTESRYDVELVHALLNANASTDAVRYQNQQRLNKQQHEGNARNNQRHIPNTNSNDNSDSTGGHHLGLTATAANEEGVSVLHIIALPHQTAVMPQAFIQEVFASMKVRSATDQSISYVLAGCRVGCEQAVVSFSCHACVCAHKHIHPAGIDASRLACVTNCRKVYTLRSQKRQRRRVPKSRATWRPLGGRNLQLADSWRPRRRCGPLQQRGTFNSRQRRSCCNQPRKPSSRNGPCIRSP